MTDFIEPRDIIPLPAPVLKLLSSRAMRLHHAVWHGTRGLWLIVLDDEQRASIKALGWEPPRPAVRASGPIINNGSGEDFLFMHRQMIGMVNKTTEEAGEPQIKGWVNVPTPVSQEARKDGFTVPPSWINPDDEVQNRRIAALKTDEYFWSRMRWWDREFKNPQYLRTLKLGELGSLLEYTVHNDMHMRWSSVPRDPATGEPLPSGREDWDISEKWDNPIYDFLGEFYSSHVNPVFWRLHGWIDDRINDWYAAHQEAHPGEIETQTLEGVAWFKPGRWVMAADPWAGGRHLGHGGGGHHHDESDAGHPTGDVETMEKVNAILFPPPTAPKALLAKRATLMSEALPATITSENHLTWF